jgi:phenylacetate-coenzyme A ligase PaaK-like adenylate-forming protein
MDDITPQSFFDIINLINEYKPFLIVGFPNLMFRICELIHKNKTILTYIPKCMDLSADFLFTCQYNFIKSIFIICDIRLSYGTIEFGQIAQQIPGTMFDYKIFDDIVDVENNEDNKLIVTNYLFETQPIIRYLTDDIGIVTKGGIIKGLIGKNKFNNHDRYNFIKINEHINKVNTFNIIINFRINITTKNIYIIVINNSYNSSIGRYFNKVYNNEYNININLCNNTLCSTIDKYSGKRSPILDDMISTKP